jgi:hypothetical protein
MTGVRCGFKMRQTPTATRQGRAPAWLLMLRLPLSVVAGLSMAAAAIAL